MLGRILVLNKMDLASPTQFKEWIAFFDQQNCPSFGVNSHNKDNVKEFLKFLQAHVRNLRKSDYDASSDTVTVMLLGIPNVGKSALANSLHQIGRITAAGAIGDSFVGGKELAQYFLGILNFSDEYKKWAKCSINQINKPLTLHHKADQSSGSESGMIGKRQNPTDHTQDFMVQKVRKSLYEIMSCFNGNLDHEKDLVKLIEAEFKALREAFQIPMDSGEDADGKVASKLLNLYRTGRLGHYTLDHLPKRRASCE